MKKKLFICLIALLLLTQGVFVLHPYIFEGMARFLIVRDEIEPADMIVVLSGDDSGERVDEGVKLYKEGYSKKLLMSGGPLAWELTSAEWMKKQAVAMGVPSDAILLEKESESTIGNAEFSLPIVKENNLESVILVTSPTHSRRAKRVFKKVFKKAGIIVLSFPVRESRFKLARWWTRHEDTQRVIWEYVSLVYYFFRGY